MTHDTWRRMDLTEAIEHANLACDLIALFDLADGRVLLLKPTGVNTEGMKTYEI